MRVLELLGVGRDRRFQARLANEIAHRSRFEVWKRTERRVTHMRLAEARGYLRARAAQVIHREANSALACQAGLQAIDRDELVAQATELVVSLLFRDLLHIPARLRPAQKAA